jgi:hypothetical protein
MTAESLIAIDEIELAHAVDELRALLEQTVTLYSERLARLELRLAALESQVRDQATVEPAG